MESGISRIKVRFAAALLAGVAVLPAYAGDRTDMSFKDFDTDKDGHLSLDEFVAQGKDDLAFKAADINGDEQVDPSEFDKYLARKASDQPAPEPRAGQPKPVQPPSGY